MDVLRSFEVTKHRIFPPKTAARSFISPRAAIISPRAAHKSEHKSESPGQLTKRQLVLGGLGLGSLLVWESPSLATLQRSLTSEKAAVLTFSNQTERNVKVYWNNYDADKELFATLPPGAQYTIDTFASHPWTVLDAESGTVLSDLVASEGFQLVQISQAPTSGPKRRPGVLDERLQMSGFDGLGSSRESYAPAELFQVGMDLTNGMASLRVDGFEEPVTLAIGVPEVAALLFAAGLEARRPSTLRTWQQCISALDARVERVLLTRLVGDTYYSRIILNHSGKEVSLDSRPSDSLALALQSHCPLFVAKNIARVVIRPPTGQAEEAEEGVFLEVPSAGAREVLQTAESI